VIVLLNICKTVAFAMSPITLTNGKLRYVSAGHIPTPSSQNFGLPDISEFGDERILPLYDIRPLPTVDQLPTAKDGTAQLLTHGFTAVQHPSIMHSAPYTHASWHDPEILQKIYVPEVKEMLKRITHAKTVIVETLLLRSSTTIRQDAPFANTTGSSPNNPTKETQVEATKRALPPISLPQKATALPSPGFPLIVGFSQAFGSIPPVPKVHLDYTPAGARTHIRLFHPIITTACAAIIAAEDRLLAAKLPLDTHYATSSPAPRWAIYSIWRPLKAVKRDPLAVGDVRSFAAEDYVAIGVPAPTMDLDGGSGERHVMESYVGRGREGQRWCYVSEQMPDEVLVIGLWDSDRERDGVGAAGAMHSSVEMEGQAGEEPRESLELRCLAIW
jgi:hypothetical protein